MAFRTGANPEVPGQQVPGLGAAAVYTAKVLALRARRGLWNALHPVRSLVKGQLDAFPVVLVESRSRLWSETDPAERRLQMGKVSNLRIACRAFHRCVLPAGEVVSFWKQVGRPGGSKGFVAGRQVQEGCVIPAIAGGICQLSNALYQVGLKGGLAVVERHAHTRRPSASMSGPDATVAWNHVDLRLRSAEALMIEAFLTADELVVRLRTAGKVVIVQPKRLELPVAAPVANSCETCGLEQCFRHPRVNEGLAVARSAWLLDAFWPEYQALIDEQSRAGDLVCVPLLGGRYRWNLAGFGEVRQARLLTGRRSWASRRLSEQGPERRRVGIEFDRRFAHAYAGALPFDATHLVVCQTLLPFLWLEGHLGGRTVDVLMTRLPMTELQAGLDHALHRHPDRGVLGDFRADPVLLAAEREALAVARQVVTPHPSIAALFGARARLVPWVMPNPPAPVPGGSRVLFPGPTAARKGAFELREVALELHLPLRVAGSQLEGPGFWEGLDVEFVGPGDDPFEGAGLVVQPSIFEDQPRMLLRALARGIPIVGGADCGLAAGPLVRLVTPGAVDELREAVAELHPE